MHITAILDWFKKARPEPSYKDFTTQLGVHVEEFGEMLDSLSGLSDEDAAHLRVVTHFVEDFAKRLKDGSVAVTVRVEDRVDFLDSLCDQIVTATGTAHTLNLDINQGLLEIVRSNNSKFDEAGQPIFDENQKVIKGPNYVKPNLTAFV